MVSSGQLYYSLIEITTMYLIIIVISHFLFPLFFVSRIYWMNDSNISHMNDTERLRNENEDKTKIHD